MATKQESEADNASNNASKKRGRRGATKKPSYMANGEFFCEVCDSANPTGFHYGRITCEGCKGFFKRVVQVSRGSSLKCRNSGRCLQDGRRGLRKCASCRYAKCIEIGMDPELVKVGSILVAWNQKKKENKRKRESQKRSTWCDSGEMAVSSSNEESFNLSRTPTSQRSESETPRSSERKSQRIARGKVDGAYHYEMGVNGFLHFKNFAILTNNPRLMDDSKDHWLIDSIVTNFKNIMEVKPRNKIHCPFSGCRDAEDMFNTCIYRSSWTDFFLTFDEICQLDEDVINGMVLESVTSCQTFFTIATGLMPGGKTLKLENDSEIMVLPDCAMEDPSFSVFQSMLVAAQTSVVKSLTTEDVALIVMLIAVTIGQEISRRLGKGDSLVQLEGIDRLIAKHLMDSRPNDPHTYQIYQDLVTISIMICCQMDGMFDPRLFFGSS